MPVDNHSKMLCMQVIAGSSGLAQMLTRSVLLQRLGVACKLVFVQFLQTTTSCAFPTLHTLLFLPVSDATLHTLLFLPVFGPYSTALISPCVSPYVSPYSTEVNICKL